MIRVYDRAAAAFAAMLIGCGSPGPNTISTLAGTGKAGLGNDGVPPQQVMLYLPQDVLVVDDAVYVLDWNNHRIRKISDDTVETVLGTGYLGDAPEGPATNASLNHPTHLSVAPDGSFILSAWHNSKVMRYSPSSDTLELLCGTGARAYGGDNGPALQALLDLPVATAFDAQGRLLIMDQANQRIRRVDENDVITTVVGPGPNYVHVPNGFEEVCVDDGQGGEVCKVCRSDDASDPGCEAFTFKPQGFGGDGGPATEAMLYLPFSQSAPPAGRIEMGPNDRLFIADTGNQRIRVLEPDGTINTVAGSGPDTYDPTFTGGYDGDGGPADEALLSRPTDVAVSSDGSFYIADTDNHCVRRVDATGVISTFAGTCGERGFAGDGGPADEALLDRPYGVTVAADGKVYIADTHNHRIRVVTP